MHVTLIGQVRRGGGRARENCTDFTKSVDCCGTGADHGSNSGAGPVHRERGRYRDNCRTPAHVHRHRHVSIVTAPSAQKRSRGKFFGVSPAPLGLHVLNLKNRFSSKDIPNY